MSTEVWIGMGVFCWVFGFIRVGRVEKYGLLIERTFVSPPSFIYLICGMPKAQSVPLGVMALYSLLLQLFGLFWIAYGLISSYLPDQGIIRYGVFLCGMFLIVIYGWILYRRNSYKIE